MNDQDKTEFCKLLKYRYFIKGERIYGKGEYDRSMYFILNGICAATIQTRKREFGLNFVDAQITTLAAKNQLKVEQGLALSRRSSRSGSKRSYRTRKSRRYNKSLKHLSEHRSVSGRRKTVHLADRVIANQ